MKKILAMAFIALVSAAPVHAGHELRSTLADDDGIIVIQLVDTETQEVIGTKRFQYLGTSSGDDITVVLVGFGIPFEEESIVDSLTHDSDIDTDSDEGIHADSADNTGDIPSEEEEVGAWNAVTRGLLSVRDSLQNALRSLESFYSERTPKAEGDSAEPEDAAETLVVPPEVVEYSEEYSDTVDAIEAPKQ